jgi:L-amino acid N-acyltransferase YncA
MNADKGDQGQTRPLGTPAQWPEAEQLAFVLDTNAFIAMEPASTATEPGLVDAATFDRLAREGRHSVYLAPATLLDIDHDDDEARKQARLALIQKFPMLEDIDPPAGLLTACGLAENPPEDGSNDAIDLRLLSQVWQNAVHYLVTDDVRLRKRAVAAGLGDRVVTVFEAASLLQGRRMPQVTPPPAVEKTIRAKLDSTDPIFQSLREDYATFDAWFTNPAGGQRPAWVIRQPNGTYAGLMILKDSPDNQFIPAGRVLKVSTFKIDKDSRGKFYGELLLKTLFHYAHSGRWESIFVTVFAKHNQLVNLFSDFGFDRQAQPTESGELVLIKALRSDQGRYPPLEFHLRFGPPAVAPESETFVVPITPIWHDVLFPDWDATSRLPIEEGARGYGNALRKAYVCRSSSRKLHAGATLIFYRSQDQRAATVVGVAEALKTSIDPAEICSFVSRRTVYSRQEVEEMAEGGRKQLLAILFRQDRLLEPPWLLSDLKKHGVVNAAPQSITEVTGRGREWIHSRLSA